MGYCSSLSPDKEKGPLIALLISDVEFFQTMHTHKNWRFHNYLRANLSTPIFEGQVFHDILHVFY